MNYRRDRVGVSDAGALGDPVLSGTNQHLRYISHIHPLPFPSFPTQRDANAKIIQEVLFEKQYPRKQLYSGRITELQGRCSSSNH